MKIRANKSLNIRNLLPCVTLETPGDKRKRDINKSQLIIRSRGNQSNLSALIDPVL